MIRVLIPFVIVAIDIYALVDIITIDDRRIRALNKVVWVLIVLLLPLVGAILWFMLGKARADSVPQVRPVAPDDDPAFLYGASRAQEQEARIRKLEEELARLDDDNPKPE